MTTDTHDTEHARTGVQRRPVLHNDAEPDGGEGRTGAHRLPNANPGQPPVPPSLPEMPEGGTTGVFTVPGESRDPAVRENHPRPGKRA